MTDIDIDLTPGTTTDNVGGSAYWAHGDQIGHAELAWPHGGGIMLGSAPAEGTDIWALEPGTFGAYAVTDDPDALFKRAVARGATVLQEPSDTSYGTRECALRDPEGNRWSFGTYRGVPRPSDSST